MISFYAYPLPEDIVSLFNKPPLNFLISLVFPQHVFLSATKMIFNRNSYMIVDNKLQSEETETFVLTFAINIISK